MKTARCAVSANQRKKLGLKTSQGAWVFILLIASLCPFSAIASLRAPKVVAPATFASHSGSFVCEIDPSNMFGQGEAKYRILRNGAVVWEGKHPFTLLQPAVTDDGVVAGYGYSEGERGTGKFLVAMIEPTGKLRLCEAVAREPSRFLDAMPNPFAKGLILDEPGNRFLVRVADPDINRARESWWVYEISSGKKLGMFDLSAGDGGPASPIGAVSIRGTPLILVHYWRYNMPDLSARFALLDSTFKEDWSMTWRRDYNIEGNPDAEDQLQHRVFTEGVILGTRQTNQFTLFRAKTSEDVTFAVQRDPRNHKAWLVSELERKKHIAAPALAEKPLPSNARVLRLLGSFGLKEAGSSKTNIFRNSLDFNFDGLGRIGLLRRDDNAGFRFVLVETNGMPIREIPMPSAVKFAWCADDRWISTAGGNAWWLDVSDGRLEPLSGFSSPEVKSLVGTRDGGFAALCVKNLRNSMEKELIVFDSFGKVRWRAKRDSQNERGLLSPEDITFTTQAQIAVLDNIRKQVLFFDLDGVCTANRSLKAAWGREPRYPTRICPERDGGVLVRDFNGAPPIVRMDADGKVVSQFHLKYEDGRTIDPRFGVRVSPEGRVWACDGDSLARVTEEGVADLVLGPTPGNATLGHIACLTVDPKGLLYAADERSGEIHVFDQDGRRLRVCAPASSDFSGQLMQAYIASNEKGAVFLNSGFGSPAYVQFDPNGARIGVKKLGLDATRERWYPLPGGGRILVLGYRNAFIVGEDGRLRREIQRRPDGSWLENPELASVAPDGSFAIVSGGSWHGASFFVNLYSAEADPVRTVVLPSGCRESCFAYTGKYLATCTASAICLFTPMGEPVFSSEFPVAKPNEHAWSCFSPIGGRELWMVSIGAQKVWRFELPTN